MISAKMKAMIDNVVDLFRSGGVNSSYVVIEHISFLFFLRMYDEMWPSLRAYIKDNKLDDEHSSNEEGFAEVKTRVSSCVKNLSSRHSQQLSVDFMLETQFTVTNPRIVTRAVRLVDQIFDDFTTVTDVGDAFEYLLSTVTVMGQGGQYVTPHSVIELIVNIIDPRPGERIIDPACGTGGFLLSAWAHQKSAVQEGKLLGALHGYDYDTLMARIALFNLLFHHTGQFQIQNIDSLSVKSSTLISKDYDVVFVNPPFSIRYTEKLSDHIQDSDSRTSDQLFLELSLSLLRDSDQSRMAIILPEGALFGNRSELRRRIVENFIVEGIISLPQGMFKPFTLVKTSILFISKISESKSDTITEKVWFFDITEDEASKPNIYKEVLERWKSRDDDWKKWKELRNASGTFPNKFMYPLGWDHNSHFFVEIDYVKTANYDLSVGKYRREILKESQILDPEEILIELQDLHNSVLDDLKILKGLLKEQPMRRKMEVAPTILTQTNKPELLPKASLAENESEGPVDIPLKAQHLFQGLSIAQQKLLTIYYRANRPLACHEAVKHLREDLSSEDDEVKFSVQEGTLTINMLENFGLLERERVLLMYPRVSEQEKIRNILDSEGETYIDRWRVPDDVRSSKSGGEK
ncbi:hypothetical protein DVH26_00250 [Paenibacillus sp. H1-7]|uniref:HsdM family class I SAM-dependent methyltransferase n=1 Tax=Paenibacillus sp. H1-7 TaxID=2282849 RepID=UPI001EF8CAE0|nr:N-6 DNA methylase [Paenibacillus sp. H1-7]ULL13048.1 hypothetical protein DVH26_00250 [Paenibacillus sp. H1-7]